MGIKHRVAAALLGGLAVGASLAVVSVQPAAAASALPSRCDDTPVGVTPSGNPMPAGTDSSVAVTITPDGRFVVFTSESPQLGANGSNASLYVRDLLSETTKTVSVTPAGAVRTGNRGAVITPDGRYVAFRSQADDLVPGDTNNLADIFVRDTVSNVTSRVSVRTGGLEASTGATQATYDPNPSGLAISDDGRYVAFASDNSALVPGDTNYHADVFLHDRQAVTTTRINLSSSGAQGAEGAMWSWLPGSVAMSADGGLVAFETVDVLTSNDGDNSADIYLRDTAAGTIQPLFPNEPMSPTIPGVAMSADGSRVAFASQDPFTADDTYDPDVFVRDRTAGVTKRVAHPTYEGRPTSSPALSITPNGRFVSYTGAMQNAAAMWVADMDGSPALQLVNPFYGGMYNDAERVLTDDGRRAAVSRDGAHVVPVGTAAINVEAGGVQPNAVRQGAAAPVVVKGWNLADVSSISMGSGVSVGSIHPSGNNSVDATVSVDPSAGLGGRTVVMTNGTGCPGIPLTAFEVKPGADVTAVTPHYLRNATNQKITLTGAAFRSGGTVSLSGSGASTHGTAVASDTSASALVDVGTSASSGPRTVTFTQPDGSSGECVDCVVVDSQSPIALGIVPSGGDKHLDTIVVFLHDDLGVDEAATEISLSRDGAAAPFTRDNSHDDMVVLHPTNPHDGHYTVAARPHDDAGNVGALGSYMVDQGAIITDFTAYGAFTGGASVASGDLDGDGVDEIVTAAGPGGGPHVAAWKVGKDGITRPYAGFMAYAPQYSGGIDVATGDVDGDGRDEIITAALAGGPHVQTWDVGGGTGMVQSSWYAYAPAFGGGVRVAAGDVDGDGRAEVITGPASNGGPHVRVWAPAGGSSREVAGWMAYAPNFLGGLTLGAGDFDGDGIDEVITGTGVGGGPHVQVFVVDGGSGYAVGGFMAYDPAFRGGVQVAGGDVDGDGFGEIVTAAGPGGGPHVRTWVFYGDGAEEVDGFMAYASTLPSGVSVATGDPDGDGDDDIVTVPYRNAVSEVTARRVV